MSDSVTPWIAARQASLSITNSQSSLKLMSIESVMPSSHLILCYPLLLLPSIPPSIRVFSNESTLRMRWPKYCSFSFSIIPSKEHPGPISFRMDWLDLLVVQGTHTLMILFSETLTVFGTSYPEWMCSENCLAYTGWALATRIVWGNLPSCCTWLYCNDSLTQKFAVGMQSHLICVWNWVDGNSEAYTCEVSCCR